MLGINIVILLFFVAFGIALAKGKGTNWIAGYNTTPAKEKEKIDQKALCKYMSRFMFALAACWCVISAGVEIGQMWLFWIGFGLFLGVTLFFVIYVNTGKRLEKKK